MKWKKEYLDLILIPSGLIVMFGYHLFLIYKYLRNPQSTVLGFENHSKRAFDLLYEPQIDATSRGPAFTVISSTIQAATFMASTSLALTSLIGTWIGSSSGNQLVTRIIYGDTSIPITSIKYISIQSFFLLAFASFIQCSRCYVNANYLLSMPQAEVPEEFVAEALVNGANFWQVGLRGLYFAITLMMWVFGPIPMFLSSVATVVVLHVLDVNKKPLHDFHKSTQKNMFRKIGEEITAVAKAIDHQERPHGSEIRASVTRAVITSTTS